MNDAVKIYKNAAGEKLAIYYDRTPENPREWANMGEFIVPDRCSYAKNESDIALEYGSYGGDAAALEKHPDVAAFLPVYVYDHSGVAMNTTGFSCPWDSGQIGWMIITRKKVQEFTNWKRINARRREKLEDYIRGEIETYSAYINGDVYGYVVYAAGDDDEIIDGCWGYYGDAGIDQIKEDHPEFTEEIA